MEAIKNRPTPHLLGGPKGPLTLASDGPMASVCWTNSRPFVALCLFIGVLLPAFQTPRLLSRFLSELPCIGRSSRGVCLCGMEASCSPHCSTIYAPSSLSLSLPLTLSLFTQQPTYAPRLHPVQNCPFHTHFLHSLYPLPSAPTCRPWFSVPSQSSPSSSAACIVCCDTDQGPVRGSGS